LGMFTLRDMRNLVMPRCRQIQVCRVTVPDVRLGSWNLGGSLVDATSVGEVGLLDDDGLGACGCALLVLFGIGRSDVEDAPDDGRGNADGEENLQEVPPAFADFLAAKYEISFFNASTI
jgi:hypothetical protein